MVKPVDLLVIKCVIVELGMIMGFHKAAAGKIIDHGWDSGNRHGKIIRPGLNRGSNAGLLRVCLGQVWKLGKILLQKACIFVAAADAGTGAVCKRRKLEV